MYFEVSGIEIHPLLPVLVAFLISLLTSSGGISGAFLILPFQMSVLGITGPTVSATNHVFNIFAIPAAVFRYIREGRMVWPLTWIVVSGTLPGVFIGAIIRIHWLSDPGIFKVFAGLVLLYIGIRLVIDIFKRKKIEKSSEDKFTQIVKELQKEKDAKLPKAQVIHFNLSKLHYEFLGEQFRIPVLQIMILSFLVGIAGGAYGIGGGAIIAPFFVTFFRLPVYTVAGPALMGTFITSIAGVVFFMILSNFYPETAISPDFVLGGLFGLGGLAGMYLGARLQKRLPAKLIKSILALSILIVSVRYILEII